MFQQYRATINNLLSENNLIINLNFVALTSIPGGPLEPCIRQN
jgi:hypothetical protein